PGGSAGGISGHGGCTGLAFWRFFSGRGLANRLGLLQRLPRRPLRRVPRRSPPPRARRTRGRVLHPSRVERRAPAFLVVAGELKVVALPRHANGDPPDTGPGVEPRSQRPERAVVGGHGASCKSDSSTQELAAWVGHGYSITWSARSSSVCGIVSLSAFAV